MSRAAAMAIYARRDTRGWGIKKRPINHPRNEVANNEDKIGGWRNPMWSAADELPFRWCIGEGDHDHNHSSVCFLSTRAS